MNDYSSMRLETAGCVQPGHLIMLKDVPAFLKGRLHPGLYVQVKEVYNPNEGDDEREAEESFGFRVEWRGDLFDIYYLWFRDKIC